jgi:hypothetical protein
MSDIEEPSAEELLSVLLTAFFVRERKGGLEWAYPDGTAIRHIFSLDFERQLSSYLIPEVWSDYRGRGRK